jgi:large subunit ribosomal protein L15
LKILGDGELSVPLKVKAHKFSKTAREKILKAKGEVEQIA